MGPREAFGRISNLTLGERNNPAALSLNPNIRLWQANTRGNCSRYHFSHARITLDRRHFRRVGFGGAYPRNKGGRGGEYYICLAEAGQNLIDISEEHRARAHDEHTISGEFLSVGIEQPRRTMQSHHGLSGAWSTLHNGDLFEGAANDCILVRRDG